jgi:carbon-monoxide dehydrogenase large subunit
METPKWETGHTITPSPHHPIGAKGIGESATVGAPAAIANAVADAVRPLGVVVTRLPVRAEALRAAPPAP